MTRLQIQSPAARLTGQFVQPVGQSANGFGRGDNRGAQVQTDFVEERVPGGRVVVPAVAVPSPAAVKRTLEGVQQPSVEQQEASGYRTLRQTASSHAAQSF
ncbi:hypothetical protein EYF80_027049 [Liparis tanakae]|uniref:Uncharacterized protein n=1 Tax=Liparis tanakae TaxID=230148 RepID=A0A4Z2H9Z2_9TELE|nr:hypothetical protein EYF80_027049 [Liparis tanakae]